MAKMRLISSLIFISAILLVESNERKVRTRSSLDDQVSSKYFIREFQLRRED